MPTSLLSSPRSPIYFALFLFISLTFSAPAFAHNSIGLKLQAPRELAGGYYATAGTFALVSNTSSFVQRSPGVYAEVSFSNGTSDSLDFAQKQDMMMLGLYTSQTTLVLDQCQKFDYYNCSKYACTVNEEQPGSIVYPNFEVTDGVYGEALVFIDQNYWNLSTSVLYARECATVRAPNVGYGLTGIIGMGIKGDAFKNFATTLKFDSIMGGSTTYYHETPPVFSISLVAGGSNGDLIFANDAENKALSTVPVAVLSANTDWEVENVASVRVGTKDETEISTKLIFDINSDAIGLPLDVYKDVVDDIQDVMKIKCQDDVKYKPECKYQGDLSLLPTITIKIADQVVEIPGKVYAEVVKILDLPSDTIRLNLRGLSPDSRDASYVTADYNDYIILDQHAMGYFYTVFDTAGYNTTLGVNNVNIRLYIAFSGSSKTALIIILVCVILGLAIGLPIYRYKKIQKARKAAQSVYGPSGMNYVELDPIPNRLS